MIRFLKDKAHILFLILFFATFSPFIIRFFDDDKMTSSSNERFTPSLIRLNSMEKIVSYTDSLYSLHNKTQFDTSLYVKTVSDVIKERFVHGNLNYKLSENWIAYLAGKLFWDHMSSVVLPEDILKHEIGLCSQQTIVMMNALRARNINVRSVGLGYKEGPGHFLCEINYKGSWHLHDVSVEPMWAKLANDHCSLEYYLSKKDSLYVAYETRIPKKTFYKLLEKNVYGEVNKMPAANMSLFHKTTFMLAYFLPACFLLLFIRSVRRRSSVKKEFSIPTQNTEEEKERLIAY
ncbi:MAG: hypothetical protein K0S32_2183 [Bacteroidetes bacterium]|nr:hypothetical protein [Bacteroidota bacterium]